MRKIAFVCLCLAASCSAQGFRDKFLNQRASFELSGVFFDKKDNYIEGVQLDVTLARFDFENQNVSRTRQRLTLEKKYDVVFEDVTSVQIVAQKEGYYPIELRYDYKSALEAKMDDLGMDRIDIRSDELKKLSGLKLTDRNAVNTLISTDTSPALEYQEKVTLRVSKINPIDSVNLNSRFEDDINLELRKAGTSQPELYLTSAPLGGILLISPAIKDFDSFSEAPADGYAREVKLADVESLVGGFSVILKTAEGHFGKLQIGAFYCDLRKNEAYLDITKIVFQEDGSRFLRTKDI